MRNIRALLESLLPLWTFLSIRSAAMAAVAPRVTAWHVRDGRSSDGRCVTICPGARTGALSTRLCALWVVATGAVNNTDIIGCLAHSISTSEKTWKAT